MVNLDLYLKAFFHSLPKRTNIMARLKRERAIIDRKVFDGKVLTQDELLILIEIIGKDALFRKAEKRAKPTLRHLNWKILKSSRFFLDLSNKLNSDPSILDNLNKTRNKNRILYLKNFLDEKLPLMIQILERSDNLYKRQNLALSKILAGEENINSYRELLQEEKNLSDEIQAIISDLQARVINFRNLVREYNAFYLRFVRPKISSSLSANVAVEFFFLIIIFLGLWLSISSFELASELEAKKLGVISDLHMLGGIIIGILDVVSFAYLIKLVKDQRIIKFFKEIVSQEMI